MIEPKSYVFQTEAGGWRIVGTRVSLDSVIISYLDGDAPETIAKNFPSLDYELVHGAIAAYLANREFFDEYLAVQDKRYKEALEKQAKDPNSIVQRLTAMKNPNAVNQ